MTIINSQVVDGRTSPVLGDVVVVKASGNNRMVVNVFSIRDSNQAPLTVTLNQVAGRVLVPLTKSPAMSRYFAAYYWLDTDLPATADTYEMSASFGLVTEAMEQVIYYLEDASQVEPTASAPTDHAATVDFEITISPTASSDIFDSWTSDDITTTPNYAQDAGQTLLATGEAVNSNAHSGHSYATGSSETTWGWTRDPVAGGKNFYHLVVAVAPDASEAVADISGTIVNTVNEGDIVSGGRTIVITLNNDTWVAAGTGPVGSTADTQALIDGITSAQSEGTGWNAEVRDNLVPADDVVRTSDTVVTITLPQSADYDITATETITTTVPAVAVTAAGELVATPTFTVAHYSSLVTFQATGAVSLTGLDYVLLLGHDLGTTSVVAVGNGVGSTDSSGNIDIDISEFAVFPGDDLMLVLGDWTGTGDLTAASKASVSYSTAL